MVDASVDATGLICPLPVLKARKALKALPSGAVLEVQATDPKAPADFRAFCRSSGDALLTCEEREGIWRIVIRRGG